MKIFEMQQLRKEEEAYEAALKKWEAARDAASEEAESDGSIEAMRKKIKEEASAWRELESAREACSAALKKYNAASDARAKARARQQKFYAKKTAASVKVSAESKAALEELRDAEKLSSIDAVLKKLLAAKTVDNSRCEKPAQGSEEASDAEKPQIRKGDTGTFCHHRSVIGQGRYCCRPHQVAGTISRD